MTNKVNNGFQTKLYNSCLTTNSENQLQINLQSTSPMQYAQYSSVALTPSTMSSPSPPLNGNFSPGYIEETDYNLVQASLNSPSSIKQESNHFINSTTNLISQQLASNMINYQLNQRTGQFIQQLTQQNQINSSIKSNKRSADDQTNNSVKRGRSRIVVESNSNSSSNQTKQQANSQPATNNSQQSSTNQSKNEQGQTIKPTRTRRTRAKSPSLVQKLKKNRRLKANDRERNRMHTLNKALERLRDKLPVSGTSSIVATNNEETMSNCANKLTKIETLRYSVNYIQALKNLLQLDYSEPGSSKSSESMLQEAAMSAAQAVASLNSSQNLLLNNSQSRYSSSFSSIFNTNSMNSGVLSTTSSLSNDDEEDDLLMIMNQDCNQEEDIFEQQVYQLN